MAEEVVIEAAPEVPAAATKEVAPIEIDESLLTIVKGRAKQPQQPDPSERNVPGRALMTTSSNSLQTLTMRASEMPS